jgi:hypothetical protein
MPADYDGLDHIFDRLSESAQIRELQTWKDKTFANIVADCEANHGAVLESYLKKLMTAELDIEKLVQEGAASFANWVQELADDVIARDVAGKFGIVYAGGLLGIRLGIVPWQEDELFDAVTKCYRGARNQLPDEGVAVRKGLKVLRLRLDELDRRKKLEENPATDWNKVDGYRGRSTGHDRYVVKGDVFHAFFAAKFEKRLVLKYLIKNNQIAMAVDKEGGVLADRKPKKQFIWPDGRRRRSYEIKFPRD